MRFGQSDEGTPTDGRYESNTKSKYEEQRRRASEIPQGYATDQAGPSPSISSMLEDTSNLLTQARSILTEIEIKIAGPMAQPAANAAGTSSAGPPTVDSYARINLRETRDLLERLSRLYAVL